jgi:hypothetical protein
MTTQYGSVFNHLMGQCAQPIPEIGMGVTLLSWSDRHAATIVDIVRYKNGNIDYIVVQDDTAIRTDTNGMSDAQTYRYERNPNGSTQRIKRNRRTGRYSNILLNHREEYYDYSF